MHQSAHQVLQLDITGSPQAWITPEEAALHYATASVAWQLGDEPLVTLRGGWNAAKGCQSTLAISPIIALRGMPKRNLHEVVPSVTKSKLLRRDRYTCAYCAQVFKEKDLQVEHIIPQSKGGAWSWSNLVISCAADNAKKGARTPEQAGMKLVYLPYTPNIHENFILSSRNIRADVHDWLAAKLPKGSRLN
jgi:5-methylcytosine-specific restriction endonuclease McrA